MEPDKYARDAEAFVSELDREYYLQYSGQKTQLETEAIYARHAKLFDRQAVDGLRQAVAGTEGDAGRRARYLAEFAVNGYLGRACRAEMEELAELEATLEVKAPGGSLLPYRQARVAQANEEDAGRRAELEVAREALLDERLTPVYRRAWERSHELVRELGWASYRDACAELSGIDLGALAVQTRAFLAATEGVYARVVDPELDAIVGSRLGEVERADVPRFFRAPALDPIFEQNRLLDSFVETMAGVGIDVDGQRNVVLDTEQRPTKSPRAFCSPVRVPDEVYLVVPRVGGRDDFAALFHEGGHTEHYAHTDGSLPFEFRYLGDNSVTESFAFLFEHLTEDSAWLGAVLGAKGGDAVARHARAAKLVMLRRYAAKLDYELELHAPGADLAAMPALYARRLGEATRIGWTEASWLADVDSGFYAACYLRAWALETFWRRELRERFGERWFSVPEAGSWLRDLWRQGQRLQADELLAETVGGELDFAEISEEFV